MKNKATLLLHSFEELIAHLTDEEAGALLKAILTYDIRGETTDFEDRALMFLYTQIAHSLDTHKEHYEKVCEARKKNASKRWDISKKTSKNDEAMQMHANAYNISINENENIKTNENENVNVNKNSKKNENECVNVNEDKKESGADADSPLTQTHKKAYGEFSNVFLTDEEHRLVLEKLSEGQRRIDSLSAYIKSTDKHYSDHYATLINWSFYGNEAKTLQKWPGTADKTKKPPGERRDPTFDVSEFTKKALNPKYVPPT